jgi:hypothetical protein
MQKTPPDRLLLLTSGEGGVRSTAPFYVQLASYLLPSLSFPGGLVGKTIPPEASWKDNDQASASKTTVMVSTETGDWFSSCWWILRAHPEPAFFCMMPPG